MIVWVIADAVMDGINVRDQVQVDSGARGDIADQEQYLGPSTLAKMRGIDDESDVDAIIDIDLDELEVPDAEAGDDIAA